MNRAETLTRALAAHLRDPSQHPAPEGIEDRRMRIYRRLFIGNVRSLLGGNFPVAAKILGEHEFAQPVRRFYSEHASHTPYFPEIAREMLRFIEENPDYWCERWPFLYELMHYEWVELALGISAEEIDAVSCDAEGDLLEQIPLVSPLAWRLAYHFPVEQLSVDYTPEEPPAEPTFLVVWRDRADKVRFLRLNPLAAQLIANLAEQPSSSGRSQLLAMAEATGAPDAEAFVQAGLGMLEDWRRRDIILGTRKAAS